MHANFKGLAFSFKDAGDSKIWKRIMEEEDPVSITLPPIYEDKLTAFQKMMLIKILREEKTVQASKEFVKKELGEVFIISPGFNLEEIFKDTIMTSPIIFILSPGADPIAYLI